MGKVIANLNQKGGVAKTTCTINLAASMGLQGKTVLVVDSDTQANATNGLGVDDEALDLSLYDIMKERGIKKEDIRNVIIKTGYQGVDLLPADIRLADLDIEIINMRMRETVMRRMIEQIKDDYDYILIDCPPSLGLVTINALIAADSIIIPVLMEAFSVKGIRRLARTIKEVREDMHPALDIEGILISHYEPQQTLTRRYEEALKDSFGDKLFKTRIRKNVAIKKSQNPEENRPAMPVYYFEKDSTSAMDYIELSKEVISKNE